MLREDVQRAAAQGEFHIYSADTIDQALELLTGFSAESIDLRVQARVEELHCLAKSFADKGSEEGDKANDKGRRRPAPYPDPH